MDLEYLVSSLGMLTGIPVRIYQKNALIFRYFHQTFPIDPITPYLPEIFSHREHIGYVAVDDFFYYEFINYQEYQIVIGPSRTIRPDRQTLSALAFRLGIQPSDHDLFIEGMQSINSMPLESLVQSLCMFNYVLNGEELNHTDVILQGPKVDDYEETLKEEQIRQNKESGPIFEHNTLEIERTIADLVSHGEKEKFKLWIKNAPAIRSGILSSDSIRNIRNTFIVSATLFSRAAIRGGLDVDEALGLSDQYIQKMDLMDSQSAIRNLQLRMILDYTERVSRIQGKPDSSSFLIDLNKYIYAHLSDAIFTNDVCRALFLSRTMLFARLKKETGKTFSVYVQSIKIQEAEDLLKHTDKALTQISYYLGFSSSSHFTRVFKKLVGVTPWEYREKHTKRRA